MTKENSAPEHWTDINILLQLERLAASCPWDKVEIWVKRTPEGEFNFTSVVEENSQFGWYARYGGGKTPEEAVDDILKMTGDRRDPDVQRRKKIAELQETIRKLEAVVIGMPPYIPNRELAAYNAMNAPVDV